MEREFKWDASARGAFKKFLQALQTVCRCVRGGKCVWITDVYLDDKHGSYAAQKVALRVRRVGGSYEATLKTRSKIKNGLAVREERTLCLPRARSLRGALGALRKRQKWHNMPLTEVQARFTIKNHRTVYLLHHRGCVCEAALDNYLTLADGHQWRRREIELELKKGSAKIFKKLIEQLTAQTNLSAAKISKVAGAEKWILHKFSHN